MAAQADFEGREIVRRPDVCDVDIIDTVSWFSEESVRLTVEPWRCGVPVEIPTNTTAAWCVCDEGGTNWIVRYDPAPATNSTTFFLAAGEGRLPGGHDFVGYVSLLEGTNILGVLDRHDVRVISQATDGGEPISPEGGAWGSVLQRLSALESAITNLPTPGTAFNLVTNASFTNFAFPRGITMEGEDIPDITAGGLPSFNFSGLVRYRYANSSWLSLVGYPCVGLFGLHGSFQVNTSGPYVVGGLGFAGGGDKRLAVTDGELTFGGDPIGGGVPAIEAGHGISIAVTTDKTAVVSAALTAGHGITISTNAQDTALAIAVPRNIDFDDVTIRGDLEVYGTEYRTKVINQSVVVDQGTNYTHTVRYTTNYTDARVVVTQVTRTTNTVDELVTVGGDVDHSRATWVREPSFTIDNTDTNAPVLAATGEWDFTSAAIDFGSNLPDLSDYATKDWVVSYHATNPPDLSGYVTSEALAEALEGYAPAGDITILTNSIARHILPAEFSPGDGGVEVDGFVTDVYSDTAAKLSTTLVLNDHTPTNQVTFEDWRGSVQTIAVDAENGYAGTFDAAPDPRVWKYCNFLVSETNTAHYITELDGTSVSFSPPLEPGQTYSVSAIRAVALDDFGLHSGSFNSQSLAFSAIQLPASGIFQSISTPDGVSLFYSASGDKLYRSFDYGSNWVVVCSSNGSARGSLATWDGVTFFFAESTGLLLKTTDGGQNWAAITNFSKNATISLAAVGDTLFFANSGSGLYRSFDAGDNFEHLTPNISGIWAIATHDGIRLFAATTSGVYRSDDRGDSWTQLTNAVAPFTVNFRPGLATADGVTVYYSPDRNSAPWLYKSTDSGETWAAVPGAPAGFAYGSSLATHDGKTLFFSPRPGALYRASPLGTTTATTPSTSVVTPVTNIVRGIYDIAVTTAGGGTTYWTLETAPDEWSIWSGSESPMGWRTVAQATNGIWSVRATNGMVQTAATCAEEAISLALTTNYLNRASKNAYSPYYGFSAFGGGIPMRWACTFIPISSAFSNAPTVTGFSTLFSKYHNAMHWDTSHYNVELLSTNPVRSSVSWPGDEETQSIIFYQKSQEVNP